MSNQSKWSQRIEASKSSTKVMYTPEGAQFQEWALNQVGMSKSFSPFIASLKEAINQGEISITSAEAQFSAYFSHNQ